MKQKEVIAALKSISAGIDSLISAISEDAPVSKQTTPKAVNKSEPKDEPMNPPEAAEESQGEGYTREELMSMGYNDLKKYGASIGAKCVGSREDIVEKVLAAQGGAVAEEAPKAVKKSEPKDNNIVPMSKGLKKKSADKAQEVEQEWLDMAEEVAAEAEVPDIVSALEEGGVSVPKGTKKSELVTMLAVAIRDGKVVLDNDDGDNVEEAAEAQSEGEEPDEEGEDIDENTHFEEFDENHVNDLEAEHMTEARANAIREFQSSVISADEIDEEGMKSFVENTCTEDEIDSLGEEYELEELLGLYLETKKRMIDDDGEMHEPGDAYEIAGEAFCCGHELKYDKKGKKYICEVCGNEYEAE